MINIFILCSDMSEVIIEHSFVGFIQNMVIVFIKRPRDNWTSRHVRLAKLVTSLRIKYLHKSSLIYVPVTPF